MNKAPREIPISSLIKACTSLPSDPECYQAVQAVLSNPDLSIDCHIDCLRYFSHQALTNKNKVIETLCSIALSPETKKETVEKIIWEIAQIGPPQNYVRELVDFLPQETKEYVHQHETIYTRT